MQRQCVRGVSGVVDRRATSVEGIWHRIENGVEGSSVSFIKP